ncbi:MAG: hypothetical protein PHR35_19700, partial [Kiritimatiellae bacterium]|nr:hypothetical protein [Kiritimatiellia bacterium]
MRHILITWLGMLAAVTVTATAEIPIAPGSSNSILKWPDRWTVFAPFDSADPAPAAEALAHVPKQMTVGDHVITQRVVTVKDPFGRVDLSRSLGGSPTDIPGGRVAYVFLEIETAAEQTATLGMGADWFLQAWLDGKLIKDTIKDGNGSWPPTALDHQVAVKLAPGRHVLAVRFI